MIYALSDARTGEIRYVGKTKQLLAKRLTQHLDRKSKTHKGHWVASVKASGGIPRAMDDAAFAEAKRLRSLGMGYEKIGLTVGASAMVVWRALNGRSPRYAA